MKILCILRNKMINFSNFYNATTSCIGKCILLGFYVDVKRVNQSIQTKCVLSNYNIHVINVFVGKHEGFSNTF